MPGTSILSLPLEIRLRIYQFTLLSSDIHSFRPQRKIGWNRPHADLSNPAQLFESEAHPTLRKLFHGKLTKGDHAAVLIALLHHAKVLCLKHEDFASLQKVVSSAVLPTAAVSLSAQARNLASIVREHLRNIDFSDKLDEIICQPKDLVNLMQSLPGLKSICLTSRHIQRYSGCIEDHIEFAKERAQKDLERLGDVRRHTTSNDEHGIAHTVDDLRRLSLRSPVTDGTRMLISPVPWKSRSSSSSPAPPLSSSQSPQWVTVDLSFLVWQHFLYAGAPYKDSWRCIKIQTLLEQAQKQDVNVVMSFRNIEFDPHPAVLNAARLERMNRRHAAVHPSAYRNLNQPVHEWQRSGTYRGDMSTSNWILKFKHRECGVEFSVRQRRNYDVPVAQHDAGMTKCRHKKRTSSVCTPCSTQNSD